MSSWACQTGSGTGCTTLPSATFTHPITITLYQVGPGDTVGPVILTNTTTQTIPFRPSADPACTNPTQWQNGVGDCFNGLAFTAVFNISTGSIVLPSSIMYGISFNTETWGASPTGTDGPYDSLNVGLNDVSGPSVGRDVDSDAVMWNTHTVSNYSTACPGATFCEDTNWAPYVPTVQIKTTANDRFVEHTGGRRDPRPRLGARRREQPDGVALPFERSRRSSSGDREPSPARRSRRQRRHRRAEQQLRVHAARQHHQPQVLPRT